MKPICLITPPSPFLLDERVFVSLGILKVAAALETEGVPVEMLDLSGVENYEEAAETHVRSSEAQIFGVTATTPQMPNAKRIRDRIRAVRQDAKLVIGGPHPTLVHAAWRNERKAGRVARGHKALEQLQFDWDHIVAGDGELAMPALVRGDLNDKIIDADDPKGPWFLKRNQLDGLAMPSRHLVDMASYRYTIEGHKATSLIAQLGCPFECTFCGGRASPMLRRARIRSSSAVVAELEHLYRTYGYTAYMFYDDELNVNKAFVELMDEVTRLQDRLGVEFRLRGFMKAELFNEAQARAMYRAGFRWVLTGFEAANDRILVNIKKKATLEDNTRCVETAHAAGLKIKALMSIGHAGESERSCLDVRDWLLRVAPEDFDVTIITTYPGSPYYDEAVETKPGVWTYVHEDTGDKLHALEVDYSITADYYKGDPDGGYKAYVYTDHMGPSDLIQVRDQIEREVRATLNIPFNPGAPAVRYEHSMGQSGALPPNILRASAPVRGPVRLPVVA